MTRKAIALATLYVTLTHSTENGVETLINHQELTGGLGSGTETRPLDWQDREVQDKLFGDIVTKSRRAQAADLEHEFLKTDWTEHSLQHGVINTIGHSDTPKSGKTWVAEQVGICVLGECECIVLTRSNFHQIFDVQEVNGERRFIKRIYFTGPKGEEVTARQVFDFSECPVCSCFPHNALMQSLSRSSRRLNVITLYTQSQCAPYSVQFTCRLPT